MPRVLSPISIHGVQFVNGMTVLDYYGLAGINSWVWLVIEASFFLGTSRAAGTLCT